MSKQKPVVETQVEMFPVDEPVSVAVDDVVEAEAELTDEPVKQELTGVAVFNFDDYQVRTMVDENEKIWFVANDVAVALGYAKPNNAVNMHCGEATLKQGYLQTAGGMQKVRLIGEADIYCLIFGSKLESAKRFQDWVFEEVLPTIRKTGSYTAPEVEQPKIDHSEEPETIDWTEPVVINRFSRVKKAATKK